MKKLIALILALACVASLAACGSAPEEKDDNLENRVTSTPNLDEDPPFLFPSVDDDDDVPVTSTPVPSEPEVVLPTEEEWAVLDAYANLQSFSSYNQETLLEVYYGITALDLSVIDKWITSGLLTREQWYEHPHEVDYYNFDEIQWDYNAFLSHFIAHEDVLLRTECTAYDILENTYFHTFRPFEPDKVNDPNSCYDDGDFLIAMPHLETDALGLLEFHIPEYIYDETGRVSKIKFRREGQEQVSYLLTCTYDENGNRIQEDVLDECGNVRTIYYEYDESNRLVYVLCKDKYSYWNYIYDAHGRVVQCIKTRYDGAWSGPDALEDILNRQILEFFYDLESNLIITALETKETWSHGWREDYHVEETEINMFVPSYDEQGRLLSMEVTGDDVCNYICGNNYVKLVFTNVFGNYVEYVIDAE